MLTLDMVAAVASELPHTAENAAQAKIVDIASPPRRRPSQAKPASYRSSEMLARYTKPPIRTNIGITEKP